MSLTKISGSVVQPNNFSVGVVTATGINVSGVITATSFSGDGSGLAGVGVVGVDTTGTSTFNNINATGVITATSFVGDISQATGAAAGLGTALSQDQSNPLNKIYYTDTILSIGSTQTVNPPDSSNIAYTQYAEIAVEEGFDLIVEDGDDLVPDILGLSTGTAAPLAGAGGRVRADNFTNKAGTGAPTFPNGVNVTGVVTATSFVGDGSNLTGVSGFASALANSGPLNNVFKTSKTLEVTAGIHTVNSDVASDNLAFMRESIIHVAAGATFHIGSGTTLRTNILNLF